MGVPEDMSALHMCSYPRKPEEPFGSREAGVTGGHELSDVSAGNPSTLDCSAPLNLFYTRHPASQLGLALQRPESGVIRADEPGGLPMPVSCDTVTQLEAHLHSPALGIREASLFGESNFAL